MIKTEALLKRLFENPENIVLITDEQCNIRYASPAVEPIFGVDSVFILGENGFDFVPEKIRDMLREFSAHADDINSSEIALRTQSGNEVFFEVTITNHIDYGAIDGMVVFMYDITGRRTLQKKPESENQQPDHLIHETTHDPHALLHSVPGLIQLAEMPESYRKNPGSIKASLIGLDITIDEMKDYYQNEKLAIKNDRIDVWTMINGEIGNLRNMPEAQDIRFDVFVDGHVPFYSDPLRVKTIVANLLSNAIMYSDPAKMRMYIQLSIHVFADWLFFTIEDNGIGIEAEHQEKIFDLFYPVGSDKKGMGLGLYIVKDTIDRLKGGIYVRSKRGEGTSFTLTIPNTCNKGK